MTTNTKLFSALAISLLLSACGSSSTNDKADNTAKENEVVVSEEKNIEQEATKLVATPVNANDKLKGDNMEDMKEKIKNEFSGWQRGRVQFLNLEGGFYGIIMDSGKKILPMNMKKEFAKNGAIVRIKGKKKNIMTIQQWGTPFTITEIELISPGTKGNSADM